MTHVLSRLSARDILAFEQTAKTSYKITEQTWKNLKYEKNFTWLDVQTTHKKEKWEYFSGVALVKYVKLIAHYNQTLHQLPRRDHIRSESDMIDHKFKNFDNKFSHFEAFIHLPFYNQKTSEIKSTQSDEKKLVVKNC